MIKTLRAPEGAHSEYGASSAHRWGACPGSMTLTAGRPRTPAGKYAIEGTAAHALAAECLTTGADAAEFVDCNVEVEDCGEVHTVNVTYDMALGVQRYVELVRQMADNATLLVEQQVDYSECLGLPPGVATGTADAIIIDESGITAVDLKFGQGVPVEAQDNTQLLLYAAGARSLAEAIGFEVRSMGAVISQPRVSAEPSVWAIPPEHMATRLGELREAVARAEKAKEPVVRQSPIMLAPYLHPGESQCRWCAAKATCPALAAFARANLAGKPDSQSDYADAFGDLTVTYPQETTDAALLGKQLSAAPLIEDWLSAVRGEAERRMLAGETVPGFKLVRGRQGARAWGDAKAVEEQLKKYRLKIEEMYDLKLISPTTAEKLAKNGAIGPRQWKDLQEHVTRSEGAISVAPESDKRDAVSAKPVADEFENLV